jgi:hypothetical protein
MPDKTKAVSVGWQLLFMFIPWVSIWAYYRIEKLQLGIVLSIALSVLYITGILFGSLLGMMFDSDEGYGGSILYSSILVGLIVLMFYLKFHYMIKWSRNWNKQTVGHWNVYCSCGESMGCTKDNLVVDFDNRHRQLGHIPSLGFSEECIRVEASTRRTRKK